MNKYNIKKIEEKINRCKNMKLDDINPDDFDELSSVKINTRLNQVDRIIDFICKTKNPYIFKVNDRLVKIEFCNSGKKAEDSITSVIKSIYK